MTMPALFTITWSSPKALTAAATSASICLYFDTSVLRRSTERNALAQFGSGIVSAGGVPHSMDVSGNPSTLLEARADCPGATRQQ
jgi:hypothetical protein